MPDIVKAIEVEEEYFNLKKKGIHSFNLIDKIRECGFESLEQYQEEELVYRFSLLKFNFVEEPMPGCVAEVFKMIESNKPGVLFADWENTYVLCGSGGIKVFNREYCDSNNIPVFPLHTPGGTIVSSTGDFSFGVCMPLRIKPTVEFVLNNVKDIIQKFTFDLVEVKGNDILVNEKKVCGSAFYKNENVLMVVMHFSFNDQSELISHICTTDKVSKPVGYINFMTRNEFKSEVRRWLRVDTI